MAQMLINSRYYLFKFSLVKTLVVLVLVLVPVVFVVLVVLVVNNFNHIESSQYR